MAIGLFISSQTANTHVFHLAASTSRKQLPRLTLRPGPKMLNPISLSISKQARTSDWAYLDETVRARTDVRLVPEAFGKYQIPVTFYHRYFASEQRSANFHGIGPSLSWDASTPIAGRAERAEITFDWGANIAVLLGRQKARAHHQSSGSYHYFHPSSLYGVVNQLPMHHGTAERSRSVVVPNVGGFAGLSFRYDDARVSFGYRADFFFGAIDGGLDGTKSYNRELYGPFATISVGLGG